MLETQKLFLFKNKEPINIQVFEHNNKSNYDLFSTPYYIVEQKITYEFKNKKYFKTLFFLQNVDIVYCDKKRLVISIFYNVSPQKITKYNENTWVIYIFKAGVVKKINLKINDYLTNKVI